MYRTQENSNNELFKIEGAFDATSMMENRERFEKILDTKLDQVVFDLSKVNFMDSSGIGAIAFLYKRLKTTGKSLILQGLHGQPEQLIRHLGLDKNIATHFVH